MIKLQKLASIEYDGANDANGSNAIFDADLNGKSDFPEQNEHGIENWTIEKQMSKYRQQHARMFSFPSAKSCGLTIRKSNSPQITLQNQLDF